MAGVFISHSSKDKAFATQIAVDLALADIPVWFDTWELGSDSLVDRIRGGIETSAFLIVVVSPNSLESKWVREELDTALQKEARTKQIMVIPIHIGGGQLPDAIKGRIYADFSTAYRAPFERVLDEIKKNPLAQARMPGDKRIIPLAFSEQIYLKDVAFEAAIGRLLASGAAVRGYVDQFRVAADPVYDRLRTALLDRLDDIHSDPHYTPAFERSLESHYQHIRSLQQNLTVGIAEIVNNFPQPGFGKESVSSACHMFAKFVRSELLAIMYYCQTPGYLVEDERAPEWFMYPLDADSLPVLYDNRTLESISVGLPLEMKRSRDGSPGCMSRSRSTLMCHQPNIKNSTAGPSTLFRRSRPSH
jgi:hypothetical protein